MMMILITQLPDNIPAHQAMLPQVKLSVGRLIDPTRKHQPGRPRVNWTEQHSVPTATLWRQANGCGHSKARLRSEPTMR